MKKGIFIVSWIMAIAVLYSQDAQEISLNGRWEIGYNRSYFGYCDVPGIATDPDKMNPEKLWFKRIVKLPDGQWQYATLILKGARFSPEVYINGQKVSHQPGGMAPTIHRLNSADIKPGALIILEIVLESLRTLTSEDASYIPPADHWRSNISSLIWDDVLLRLHGNTMIDRMIPFTDFNKKTVDIHYSTHRIDEGGKPDYMLAVLRDISGKMLCSAKSYTVLASGNIHLRYGDTCKPWSPAHPTIYRLELNIFKGGKIIDQVSMTYGMRDFSLSRDKLHFILNNEPVTMRAGTVVWHRWVRDTSGRELAWDTTWFAEHVIRRLKEHGANGLRFHLGSPPERFLDLCDQYGLLVQLEWSFFHGLPASEESLIEQWSRWLDMAMRHPSVTLIHPYNETEGNQLNKAWNALNKILPGYPPLVLEDRDVIHIHKYWWSLFENLGLYYDHAGQFPKAIMADEFGGNYLDGNCDMGGYKTLKESYMRFLGRTHTRTDRCYHHTISNSQIAEYWRRIGAAGFSPFCILGSWEDGNHWYLGDLKKPMPKPVWDALTAAWSPQSVSIEMWDRNITAKQKYKLPVYFFNETSTAATLLCNIVIEQNGEILLTKPLGATVPAHGKTIKHLYLTMPKEPGRYTIKAILLNQPSEVKYPVISQWNFTVLNTEIPAAVRKATFGILPGETELIRGLKDEGIIVTEPDDDRVNIIIGSAFTWKKVQQGDKKTLKLLEATIDEGKDVVLLDIGPQYKGQGYPEKKSDLGPLQGVTVLDSAHKIQTDLIKGISIKFTETAEPESHIHPTRNDSSLWNRLDRKNTWLWNGMRGGLIVPAAEMEIQGLSPEGFLSLWKTRGAEEDKIRNGPYFAYVLQDFYSFSEKPSDNNTIAELRKKVKFLADDAPALAASLNPNAPVQIIDLTTAYQSGLTGQASQLTALVNAGKNLTKVPVIMIEFGHQKGQLLLSQLFTAGRITKTKNQSAPYAIRYDPATIQFVMNMAETVLKKE